MEINTTTIANFRADFKNAVKPLEEKYGVIIEPRGVTYDNSHFYFKVEVQNGTNKEDINKEIFEKNCERFGLEKDDFGKVFKSSTGEEYQIIGLKPNKRKNVVLVKKLSNGEEYICSPEAIPFVVKRTASRMKMLQYHNCKYCGKLTVGESEDELCPECQRDFGHKYYSEL